VENQKFWVQDGRRQDIWCTVQLKRICANLVLNSQMMCYSNQRSGIYRKGRTQWISSIAYIRHVLRIRSVINTELGTGTFAQLAVLCNLIRS
jgi:hypothetical protein